MRAKHHSKNTQQQPSEPKKRGRKPTGRRRRQMYLTDEEREQLMTLLHDIRRDEKPVRYSDIKTQANEEYTAAIKREAQGAHRPVHTIGYYRAETLYKLIGIPCKASTYKAEVEQMKGQLERERAAKPLTVKELNAWAERMEEKQRLSWERIKALHEIE